MKLNHLIEQLSWKQIAFISLGILILFLIIHDMLLISYIANLKKSFNSQFNQAQQSIQKKLADSDKEFKRRNDWFDKQSQDFEKYTWDMQRKTKEYLDDMEKQQAESTARFNQAFSKMPAILMKEFSDTGKEMQRNYFKETAKMDKEFNKNIDKLKK